MRHAVRRQSQRGAVIVTVCLFLLFLLGFMGIALDFGHLFVVRTELQTAADSCALAAAQELDGQSDALTRATSAGLTAGNLNRVNFQSATWSGKGQLTAADVTFKDAGYAATTSAGAARYVECRHTQPGVPLWLLQALGAVSGDTTSFPAAHDVAALAVATRASAQTTCPVPIALKPKGGGAPPNFGFSVGEWVTLLMSPGAATNGQIGWANLDGSNDAAETVAEMNGSCGTKVGDTLGTPGVQATVADVWNGRFGIYKNSGSPTDNPPDFTGYSYTTANWPSANNAFSGAPGAGAGPTAANFVAKRLAFASCDDTGTRLRGANSCESITGLSLNSFTRVAAPGAGAAGGFAQYGTNRRLVTIPVIDGASRVTGFACMLMLQPIPIPMADVKLEFRGNAGAVGSPCTTNGLPGGSAGPLVPVLVR
jgi:Flp pilus assembly protein TadG